MDMFGVSTGQLVAHMLRRAKFETSNFSQAYRMDYNKSQFIVGNSVTRPIQFAFGALPSGQHLLKNRDMGGIQQMFLNISK